MRYGCVYRRGRGQEEGAPVLRRGFRRKKRLLCTSLIHSSYVGEWLIDEKDYGDWEEVRVPVTVVTLFRITGSLTTARTSNLRSSL